MCLILFALDHHPDYRLVLAANRDEFFDRPTLPLAPWEEAPFVFGGRDAKRGGTWLGVTETGRLAAVTNFRQGAAQDPSAPSRGKLVSDFLLSDESAETYIARNRDTAALMNGFNLLLFDGRDLWWFCNRGPEPRRLEPGLYGLSNRFIDTPWPKVEKGKKRLARLLADGPPPTPEGLLDLLHDEERPPDDALPDTGVGRDLEKLLSPMFIISPGYGTRCSTAVLLARDGNITITERTFTPEHGPPKGAGDRTAAFMIHPAG